MTKTTGEARNRLTNLGPDIRYGIRTLRRSPGFTLVAVITLALGIGAATAMFSVLHKALWRSLPFPNAERLVFGRSTFDGNLGSWVSFPDYLDYRDQSETMESLATIRCGSGLVTVTGAGEPEQARITSATSNLFATLGVVPHLGRFSVLDELPEAGGGEVVISYGFWQSWFGGASDVLGRSLSVGGNPLTVVGVLPVGFHFYWDADLWTPPDSGNSDPITRRYHNWFVVGRMAPSVSLDEAQLEFDVISAQLRQAYPESNRNKALQLDGLQAAMVEGYAPSLLILAGAITFVLLIACGNVANLLLARGSTRTTEMAVRTVLGATRFRLGLQFLVECIILAMVGGILGIVMAIWLKDLILGFVSMDLLGIEEVGLSLPMFAVALALSLATLLLFGVFPSLVAAQANPAEDLKTGSRGSASGRRIRCRSALVILQVALSVILLVGSGLLIRSFARLRGIDPGFRVDNLLTATVSLPSDGYQEDELRIQFFESLHEQIKALPGVETVGMINRLPILQRAGNTAIWSPENPPDSNVNPPTADRRVILPGYFKTMGITLVEGRVLETTDVAGSRPVVVLNRATAEALFPDGSAVGRQVAADVKFQGPGEPSFFEVVGVVEDHHLSSLTGAPRRAMFFTYSQQTANTMRLAVGTATNPKSLIRPIQERVWELDRDIVLSDAQTMDEALANSVAGTRSVTTIMGLFAIVALALVVLGLYGVLSFFVTQKTHEIGIRVALGAHRGSVLQFVITRGMRLVGAGLILGTIGAFGATRMVNGMLFQISATDPVTFAGVTGFFLIVALAACILPAWTATRVDPMEALRAE